MIVTEFKASMMFFLSYSRHMQLYHLHCWPAVPPQACRRWHIPGLWPWMNINNNNYYYYLSLSYPEPHSPLLVSASTAGSCRPDRWSSLSPGRKNTETLKCVLTKAKLISHMISGLNNRHVACFFFLTLVLVY